MSPFTKEEQYSLVEEINALLPEHIKFSHDGYMPALVVLKTKNRVYLNEEGKIKIKGSALKSSKIEKGIKSFHNRCINSLLSLSDELLLSAYTNVCRDLATLSKIDEWTSKKSISAKSVTGSTKMKKDGTYPTNKIMDALKGTHYQLGDKFNFYTTIDDKLKLESQYDPAQPDHNFKKLLGKIYTKLLLYSMVLVQS
jgi:DNA polymerase elongation subunit (family B)